MCAVQSYGLKFLSEYLMEIRYCEGFHDLSETEMLRQKVQKCRQALVINRCSNLLFLGSERRALDKGWIEFF